MEDEGMFPPRFRISVSEPSGMFVDKDIATFTFTGACESVTEDIPLIPCKPMHTFK